MSWLERIFRRRQLQQETKTWEAYAVAVSKVLRATQRSLPGEAG
jgi:hypothetical protein